MGNVQVRLQGYRVIITEEIKRWFDLEWVFSKKIPTTLLMQL